ncbi:DUF2017 family protein [Labedella populi]|uniref:DUF2017 family protein n=1 Tax=Labedella populi TaxID=2498850 RepID=UPI00140C13A7|nr:DUF2017 family protein [Labedella populi]
MSAFLATTDGRVLAHFDASEVDVLLSLSRQFSALLHDAADPAHLVDPAIARLFPAAYRDDAAASDEFRRYTQKDLASAKLHAADRVQSALDGTAEPSLEVVLPDGRVAIGLSVEDGWSWLRHLTDLRLTLAARMGVVDDTAAFDDEPDPDVLTEDELLTRSLFDWVGYVQELFVAALEDVAGTDTIAGPSASGPSSTGE